MDASRPGAVSRRRLLAAAAAAATAPLLPAPSFSAAAALSPDPVLPLWREWRALHCRAALLCRRWQRIETHLMRRIGVPRVRRAAASGTWLHSHAEIDEARGLSRRALRALHAGLTAQEARWDEEATALGFEALKQQEIEANDQEAEAVRSLFATPATSFAGVEAKLTLMLHLCRTGSDDPEFPAFQLCASLADLQRLRRSAPC